MLAAAEPGVKLQPASQQRERGGTQRAGMERSVTSSSSLLEGCLILLFFFFYCILSRWAVAGRQTTACLFSANTSASVYVRDVHVCVSQSPCLSQSPMNTNRSARFCTLRGNGRKQKQPKERTGNAVKTWKTKKEREKESLRILLLPLFLLLLQVLLRQPWLRRPLPTLPWQRRRADSRPRGRWCHSLRPGHLTAWRGSRRRSLHCSWWREEGDGRREEGRERDGWREGWEIGRVGRGGGEREGIESKRIRGIEEKEEGTRRVGKVLNEGRGGNYNSGRALFCLQHLCHSLLLSLPSPAHMPFFFLLCLLHHPPNHHLLLYPPRLPNQSLSSFCGHQSPPANPKLLLRSTVIRPTSRH